MTGDEAFRTAALAIRSYGVAGGGLKQDTLKLVRELHGTASWFAMPRMSSWKRADLSDYAAAARTAVQLGIPGKTFASVVYSLRKTYPRWLKAIEENAPARCVPDGDTGRTLKVRFAFPWLSADHHPLTELMGVKFGADGFGLAPDNRDWRRLIDRGQIALYGVVGPSVGKNLETNNQDAR